MKQRGRRPTAALSIVAGTSIDNRPAAPENLSEAEVRFWDRVVNSEAQDTFKTAALQSMLADFCRQSVEVDNLSEALNGLLGEADGPMIDLRLKLLRARDGEARGKANLATKLRITNQARYQASTAAVMVNNATSERKLWERKA